MVSIRKNEAELVVQLDGDRPHGVFDPRPFDADVETVAHFALELRAELAPEESGNVVRLDGMDRRARQVSIDSLQIRLLRNTMSVAYSHCVHAPVVSVANRDKIGQQRRANSSSLVWIRLASHPLRCLRPFPVRNGGEGVVHIESRCPYVVDWPASQLWPLKQICSRNGSHVGTRT